MEWHADICFICLDTFNSENPRLFFHNCIHALCRECLDRKLEYCDKKKIKLENITCDYGHCNKPILKEAIHRNMRVHKIDKNSSMYVYDYASYEIPDDVNLLTKDRLQDILIRSSGLKNNYS
jgi:hypothetical protein